MIGWDTVLCAAAALCVSGRGALLLLVTLSLTQLFTCVVSALWKWWGLAHTRHAAVLTAVAFGSALWRCFSAIDVQNTTDLGPLLPLLFVFVLSGVAADNLPSMGRFFKSLAALLLVGCLREALAAASLFGFPLGHAPIGTIFGRSADGTLGIGGILIAAVVVWLWGLSSPLRTLPPSSRHAVLSAGVFTASAGCVLSLFPALSVTWRFWSVLVVGTLLCYVASLSDPVSVIAAAVLAIPANLSLVSAMGRGLFAALVCAAIPPLINRLARAPLPRRFAGPPLYLTLAAVTLAVWGAL